MFTSVSDCRLFDVQSDEVRARGASLSLSLELDPTQGAGPGETTWRLGLENEGDLEVRELQPLAADGRPLSEPFSLAAGEHRTLSWDALVEPGREAAVSVAGVDSEGRIVSERATAPVRSAPVKPAPEAIRERATRGRAPAASPEASRAQSAPVEPAPPKPSTRRRSKRAERERAHAASAAPPSAPPAPPSEPPASPAEAAPARPRRRRAPLVIAALVAAVVAAAAVAVAGGGGGGGAAAGSVFKRLPMPGDASVLTADNRTAVVSGPGSTLTEVRQQDDTVKSLALNRLGSVIPSGQGAPDGRSIALDDSHIWVDSGEQAVVQLDRDGTKRETLLGVPRSTNHQLAVARGALWVLAPDPSEVARFSADVATPRIVRLGVPASTASHLAVSTDYGYVLFTGGHPERRRIVAVDSGLHRQPSPAGRLTGSAMRTGDDYLMLLRGNTLWFSLVSGGKAHTVNVGPGVNAFDLNAGSIWTTYRDGTLKRFNLAGEQLGRPLALGGMPLALDARTDRAWVLVKTKDGKRFLLDVRP
jgi:hypothetical protein